MNDPVSTGATFSRASKVRGAKFTKPKASRRGGLAARDSVRHDSGHQAGAKSPSLASRFENHPSSDAESHDSASREISVSAELRRDKTVKRSSSRWADRPVPVLQVEFPNPWRILANSPKNLKWSGRWDSNPNSSLFCLLRTVGHTSSDSGQDWSGTGRSSWNSDTFDLRSRSFGGQTPDKHRTLPAHHQTLSRPKVAPKDPIDSSSVWPFSAAPGRRLRYWRNVQARTIDAGIDGLLGVGWRHV